MIFLIIFFILFSIGCFFYLRKLWQLEKEEDKRFEEFKRSVKDADNIRDNNC